MKCSNEQAVIDQLIIFSFYRFCNLFILYYICFVIICFVIISYVTEPWGRFVPFNCINNFSLLFLEIAKIKIFHKHFHFKSSVNLPWGHVSCHKKSRIGSAALTFMGYRHRLISQIYTKKTKYFFVISHRFLGRNCVGKPLDSPSWTHPLQ